MTSFVPFSLNIRGQLHVFTHQAVMGILNVTPDSFYDDSRAFTPGQIARKAEMLIEQGADIIDVGGYSSRPGADDVDSEEEIRRLELGISAVRKLSSDIPISVDTFRADVAEKAVCQLGGDIINDISGGMLDPLMLPTVVATHAPYVMMHMRGTPATMQENTHYDDITAEILKWFSGRLADFSLAGAGDIIVDPGIGFGKSREGNFALLDNLECFKQLGRPILVGLSRKSMIYRTLDISPADSLNGTTVLNTLALERGASILRVHDVKEAKETIRLLNEFRSLDQWKVSE